MTIGFKEWTLVCHALAQGTTSLILRKGGIAEGRAGFRFAHPAFCLFPTHFHEQLLQTRLPPDTLALLPGSEPDPGALLSPISLFARAEVQWTHLVTDPALLEKLLPHHILQPSVVEERFHYELKKPRPGQPPAAPSLHLAFLRVWRAETPWLLPASPAYGGCRSWVDLPEMPPDLNWIPALSDAAHLARAAELERLLLLQ